MNSEEKMDSQTVVRAEPSAVRAAVIQPTADDERISMKVEQPTRNALAPRVPIASVYLRMILRVKTSTDKKQKMRPLG